jgi:hypothetical protein
VTTAMPNGLSHYGNNAQTRPKHGDDDNNKVGRGAENCIEPGPNGDPMSWMLPGGGDDRGGEGEVHGGHQ